MILVALLLSGQAAAAMPVKQDDSQRVKCHVEDVTGQLAGRRRVCRTAAEWRQEAEASAAAAQRMVDQGLVAPGQGGGG